MSFKQYNPKDPIQEAYMGMGREDEQINEADNGPEQLQKRKSLYSHKTKDGDHFVVTDRDTKGMAGQQDKYMMHLRDENGKTKKIIGSHPNLSGAKKYGLRHHS